MSAIAKFENLVPLTGPEEEHALWAAATITTDGLDFSDSWLESNRPTVLPCESGEHFRRELIPDLSQALEGQEWTAVVTDRIENHPRAFRLAPSIAALTELNRVMGPFAFVIFNVDRSLVILCTKLSYYLVAGSEGFVGKVVGLQPLQCQLAFWRFAQGWSDRELQAHLHAIAQRYLPRSLTDLSLRSQEWE